MARTTPREQGHVSKGGGSPHMHAVDKSYGNGDGKHGQNKNLDDLGRLGHVSHDGRTAMLRGQVAEMMQQIDNAPPAPQQGQPQPGTAQGPTTTSGEQAAKENAAAGTGA